MKLFLRILVFLVGMSMSFTDLPIRSGGVSYSVSFFMVGLYAISIIPILTMKFNAVVIKYTTVLICPVLFYLLLALSNALQNVTGQPVFDTTIVSCIVLFICLLIHSEYDSKALHLGIIGLGIGTIILSILFPFGIGVTYTEDRLQMFGANANTVGYIMYLGSAIIAQEFIIRDYFRLKMFKFIFIIPLFLAVPMVLESGSRITTMLLFVLLLILILTYPTKYKLVKVMICLTGLIVTCILFINLMTSDSVIAHRMMLAFNDHDTGGRTDIWNVYIPHVIQNPIIGVGKTGQTIISQMHYGKLSHILGGVSPHNVLIEVALYTGFVGLAVMLVFWTKAFAKVAVIYKTHGEILPLLLAVALIAQILSSQILEIKFAWLIFAYILTWENSYKMEQLSTMNTEKIVRLLRLHNII